MKKLLLIATAICLMTTPALADVLWDQSTPNAAWGGINDSQSGCAPLGNTTFLASDVTFAENVEINSITTWYTNGDDQFAVYATTAYLSFWEKTGPLPIEGVDNPMAGTIVPVTVTTVGDYQLVTADGLDTVLAAGDYWVSFSPIAMTPAGFTDQHMVSTTLIGEGMAFRPVCATFPEAWYSSWDVAMEVIDVTLLIEGVAGVVSNENTTWSATKALYR